MIYNELLKRIENSILKNKLIADGDCVLVALSGGGDSIFLLHMLYNLKDKLNFSICAAHLNHSLRAEADSEEDFVKALCSRMEIECYTKKADIPTLSQNQKKSSEEVGRQERYSFFEALKKKHKITKIATAHHLDDNAETILMNFIRGGGGNGLKGIEPIRADGIIRPLLNISKKEIIACCEEMEWEYKTDLSNFEPVYTRNKIRLELIPKISEYNQSFSKVITENASLFAEDEAFLEEYTSKIFKENYDGQGLSAFAVRDNPPAVSRRLIQALYKEFTGTPHNLSLKYINSVLSLTKSGQSVSLPKGRIALSYNRFVMEGEDNTEDFEYSVTLNAPVFINEKYWVVKKAEILSKNTFILPDTAELALRSKRNGDVFFPVGMKGRKKLSDLFTDEKIPRNERGKIPILTCRGEIVSVAGKYKDRRFYEGTGENRYILETIK